MNQLVKLLQDLFNKKKKLGPWIFFCILSDYSSYYGMFVEFNAILILR